MNLKNKIKREKRQLKRYNKVKKVGLILTIIGAAIFISASLFNLIKLFSDCYDGASNFKIFTSIIFFIIKELWVSNLFKVGLFILIMFASFANKKLLNIERYEKELVQSVVAESEVIDIK